MIEIFNKATNTQEEKKKSEILLTKSVLNPPKENMFVLFLFIKFLIIKKN
jgi:hypothetical protein